MHKCLLGECEILSVVEFAVRAFFSSIRALVDVATASKVSNLTIFLLHTTTTQLRAMHPCARAERSGCCHQTFARVASKGVSEPRNLTCPSHLQP